MNELMIAELPSSMSSFVIVLSYSGSQDKAESPLLLEGVAMQIPMALYDRTLLMGVKYATVFPAKGTGYMNHVSSRTKQGHAITSCASCQATASQKNSHCVPPHLYLQHNSNKKSSLHMETYTLRYLIKIPIINWSILFSILSLLIFYK